MVFLKRPEMELLYKGTGVHFLFDNKDRAELINMLSAILPGEEYEVSIKRPSKRRSLNANNYHWTLCDQIAKALKTSKYVVHNQLMVDYGTDWLYKDNKRTYVLMRDDDAYLDMKETHYRPTDATEDRKGILYRWFVLLLPSHLMDTAQMSALIDGTINEARELGIDTRTPDEIERMKQLWAAQPTGLT